MQVRLCFTSLSLQKTPTPSFRGDHSFSPVVIVCETNCVLAIGTMPVLTFPKENIYASVTYLMACYYAFHLTFPKCIATLLSVLQTEVLSDTIRDRDMTSSYKKAMAEGKRIITD